MPKPTKTEPAKGDRWLSTVKPWRGFVVESVSPQEIVVKVDRAVPSKDGELKTESRLRSVPRAEFPIFARSYRKES